MADVKTEKKDRRKLLTAIIAVAFVAVIVLLIILLTQKNGFVRDGDKVYYYRNGEKVVGVATIDNEHYYFGPDGEMYTGWLQWGDKMFYYRQGKGKDDLGGTLLTSTSASMTDANGDYWYVEFGASGDVEHCVINKDKYQEDNVPPPPLTEPVWIKPSDSAK